MHFIYLDTCDDNGVLDCAATILCGSDAVTDPVLGWIITPLPHGIAQLLSSPHLYRNHSIFSILYTILFCCFIIISTLGNEVYSWLLRM
jgi:hypothetical protein